LILDAETGMVIDVNPFLIKMLGYSHEQFLGKTVWELAFLNDLVSSRDNLRKLQQEKYIRYDDLPLEASDGRQIDVEFVSNVYEVGDTKVIQCNIRDITDRKRAVQALQDSEQKLKATVYGSPIPQFVIDRDHRVVYWNKALEELTGGKAEEMVGTDNYWSAFYREKRPCLCDLLVDGNAGSIPEWYGAQCRMSWLVADAFEVTDFFPNLGDGGKWLFFTAVALRDSEGNVIGAMETFEDVTSRIQAEMEIHQLNEDLEKRVIDRTAQLQATNKELEAFSYSVSHDLRAPLRALDGFSRIVLEDYASLLPEEAVSHLNRIRASALQMGRLIDDLLEFSRLGRQPLTKHSVKPGDLAREIWEALAGERKGRKVELSVAEMPDCQADPALLRQVYFNLLSNALKFTRRREPAIIEVGCTRDVESADTTDIAQIERTVYFVKDNGVGFDMQFANKLFGVFQRLHRAEEYEGTGVGLAIVHRIVARHGGRVWAHSELDKGATFYLTLGDAQIPTVPTAEKAMV
jgi:PAS domain S-box-containing protein